MNIDMPCAADIPVLKELWREAFSDSEEYIDGFMNTAFSEKRSLLARTGGRIAAALYWFDYSFSSGRVAYLYAIATFKEFRGRGICKRLMEYTHRHLESLGYVGSVLVPGEKSLFDFYGGMGYKPFGGISVKECRASDTPAKIERIGALEYCDLRRRMLPTGAVLLEGASLDYLALNTELYRGEDFLLAASRGEGRLFGIELLGNTERAGDILSALGCDEGSFRTVGNERPFAMYLPFDDESPAPTHFGIAFD